MDDPDLLYEDLFEDLEDGKAIIKTSLHEMEDRMKILSTEAEELRLQVRNLQDQKEGLSKQNEVLTRNISCLFKTAQMEISRKDKQIRSLQEESLKMNACNRASPASTASTQGAGDRGKPDLTVAADHLELQGDCKGSVKKMSPESGCTGKLGHHDGKHGDSTAMASRADCKGSKETCLTSSGMKDQAHQRGDHCDYAEKHKSCGKGSEPQDEMWKRRRREGEYVASGKEYHRRRADERYPLDAKRGEGVTNAYRSSDANKASERREKWNRS